MRPLFRLAIPVCLAIIALALVLAPVQSFAQGGQEAHADQVQINTDRIQPGLLQTLAGADPQTQIRIIVEWPADPELAFQLARGAAPGQAANVVIAGLKQDALQRSASLIQMLEHEVAAGTAQNLRSFWISPVAVVEARPEVIYALSLRSDVKEIRHDGQVWLEKPISGPTQRAPTTGSLPLNLEMIRVDLAESALGLDGSGVVVANIDGGIDWLHPGLNKSYRGYGPGGLGVHFGNWHVSTNEVLNYPYDPGGHGTHTMGIMVADDGQGMRVGVATGAQ